MALLKGDEEIKSIVSSTSSRLVLWSLLNVYHLGNGLLNRLVQERPRAVGLSPE